MEACLDDVRTWMLTNKLELNGDKTEVLLVVRKNHKQNLESVQVQIGPATIRSQTVVKNLGAKFDRNFTMGAQVLDVKKRACFHLRNISLIRPYLSSSACARAIHATVTSRLDFNNGLLLGASKSLLKKLQLVQNSAARILTDSKFSLLKVF